LQAANESGYSLLKIISYPAPFDYFRPLPKLFFHILSRDLNASAVIFRIIIIILQIFCTVLVYNFTSSVNYPRTVSFISALLFSVLACHSETLFFINCINEIFSAVFILAGLTLFAKKKSLLSDLAIIVSFLFALLSRESAVCFIPLIVLVNIRTGLRKWTETSAIMLIPFAVYISFRIFSETYFAGSNIDSTLESLDLNPLKIIYKIFHYFINMIIPVKVLFEFTGFDNLEKLVTAFRKPSDNLPVFLSLSITVVSVSGFVIYFLFKTLKKEIIFPLLFILFTLAIYFLSFNTAERFLYLPSAGLCILLALFFDKLKLNKFAVFIFVIFVTVHASALLSREHRHKQAADYSAEVMTDLHRKTSEVKSGSIILLENIPPKKYGIFFLSPYNFQSNWDFNFPDKKITFLFKETVKSADREDLIMKFSDEKSEFEIVKK
jgi:hypothetical protein